jgi:hypothetical protein
MLPWMDEGGVEALRRCGFVVEEEMHDGALSGSVRPMRGEKGGMALRPCGGEEGGPSAQVTERGVADRMWAWQSLSLSGGTTGAGMHWGGGGLDEGNTGATRGPCFFEDAGRLLWAGSKEQWHF